MSDTVLGIAAWIAGFIYLLVAIYEIQRSDWDE